MMVPPQIPSFSWFQSCASSMVLFEENYGRGHQADSMVECFSGDAILRRWGAKQVPVQDLLGCEFVWPQILIGRNWTSELSTNHFES